MIKASLFTVSFAGDAPWMPFLLRSTAKHVTGFHEHVIAIPNRDYHIFNRFGLTKEKIVTFDESGFKNGFMAHQYYVMLADHFCSGDVVVNVDSDCIFTSPVTPETYTDGDKCVNLCTKYGATCDSPWRPGVENLLQRSVEYEFMRRHGNTYPINLYAKLRERVSDVHNKTLAEIIQPMGRAANFSEFNCLGAYGYISCQKSSGSSILIWSLSHQIQSISRGPI